MINELIIPKPDDMHLHLREGDLLRHACKDTGREFARAIVMPNLKNFSPLMCPWLTVPLMPSVPKYFFFIK